MVRIVKRRVEVFIMPTLYANQSKKSTRKSAILTIFNNIVYTQKKYNLDYVCPIYTG